MRNEVVRFRRLRDPIGNYFPCASSFPLEVPNFCIVSKSIGAYACSA